MKTSGFLIFSALSLTVFVCTILFASGNPQKEKIPGSRDSVSTYRTTVLPLLQSNCKPCHFPGGKVYAKLPFDEYQTVASLGKKLNTRFKKKQQAIINSWVDRGATER